MDCSIELLPWLPHIMARKDHRSHICTISCSCPNAGSVLSLSSSVCEVGTVGICLYCNCKLLLPGLSPIHHRHDCAVISCHGVLLVAYPGRTVSTVLCYFVCWSTVGVQPFQPQPDGFFLPTETTSLRYCEFQSTIWGNDGFSRINTPPREAARRFARASS